MLGRLSIIILNTDDSIRLVNTPDVMKCKYINKFSSMQRNFLTDINWWQTSLSQYRYL